MFRVEAKLTSSLLTSHKERWDRGNSRIFCNAEENPVLSLVVREHKRIFVVTPFC
jgi:hypothetical protein